MAALNLEVFMKKYKIRDETMDGSDLKKIIFSVSRKFFSKPPIKEL